MNPDHVQALVARCLVDPDFLATLQGPEGATGDDGKSPKPDRSALLGKDDLERISLFRAFIVKVKHNSVRRALPLTLRLLPLVGEELTFFQYYAPVYLTLRSSGPLPLERQIELTAEHLRLFLEQSHNPARVAVGDVLTHELTLWSCRFHGLQPEPIPSDTAIVWRGRLETRQYSTDVVPACAALAARTLSPPCDLREREHTLAYWRANNSDAIAFFEIDELTALLFSLVDGHRSLADIAERVAAIGLDQIASSEIEEFFDDLAERGLIQMSANRFGKTAARA